MITTLRRSWILILTLVTVFVLPVSAMAAGGMSATFESTPLFAESDIAPGATVTKTMSITNNDLDAASLYAEALNTFGGNTLGPAMTISIALGNTVLYSNTLNNFFDNTPHFLTDIAAGATDIFSITMSFASTSGDVYQGASLGFDFCVGFSGGNQLCDGSTTTTPTIITTTTTGGGGGGGGGGPIATQSFYIFNELDTLVSPTASSITWNTNLPGTTQVVYGLKSAGPYSLSLSATNFGYPNSTTEDTFLVTDHFVVLSNLTPGEVYLYRVVSRQSLSGVPSVSPEYELAVPQPIASVSLIPSLITTPGVSQGGAEDRIGERVFGGGESGLGLSIPSDVSPDSVDGFNSQIATAFAAGIPDSWECVLWFVLSVIATYIFWWLIDTWRKWRDSLKPSVRRTRQIELFLVGMIAALGIAVFFGEYCIVIPCMTAIVFLSCWLAVHLYRSEQ